MLVHSATMEAPIGAAQVLKSALLLRFVKFRGYNPGTTLHMFRNRMCRMYLCRLRRACSALSALAADPPSASPGSGTTPDVRTLLAAAAADLEAAKQRRAALVAEPPAGPAEVPAILASAGPAVARHEAADANMRGLPAEGCAAVDAAADAVAADELHVSVAVATEEDADQEERETPAAAALLMIGADAVSLPGAAGTAEGAAVACAPDMESFRVA